MSRVMTGLIGGAVLIAATAAIGGIASWAIGRIGRALRRPPRAPGLEPERSP